MLALAIILAVLALLAFTRFGVLVRYSEEGFSLKVKAGPVRITILPKKPKPADEKGGKPAKKKKPAKVKKAAEAAAPGNEKPKGGAVDKIKRFLPPAIDTLGRLRRKLRVDWITVRFTSASEDPCDAALNYGRISAAEGAAAPLLARFFNIRKSDFSADVSYGGGGSKIYADAGLTMALWEIIYVACGMLPALLNKKAKSADVKPADGKAEKDGQASDK